MLEKKKVTIASYKCYIEGFAIDIVDDEENDCFEAWLYSEECAIKQLMFGLPKKDVSNSLFMTIVSANLEAHISAYCNEYLKI
ncbi:hypothetical protein BXO88_10870 [Oribacterium sp. C9]|uniref:hypothetical protein n=1 Tax=Oribacterium sp. C9 TaxID=1943579 RepID=UPI00098F4C48|nr:hypothetical protein [Oribacterium sp. C9]OON85754.1 hypothetical protein BXO88_10870 [Oribacterium sp. C9]